MQSKLQAENDRDVIKDNKRLLCDNVQPGELLFKGLKDCGILTEDDEADIRIEQLRHGFGRGMAKLTDIIIIHGPYCYQQVIQCLVKAGYNHVAERLQSEIRNTDMTPDFDAAQIANEMFRGRREINRRNIEELANLVLLVNQAHKKWKRTRKELIKGLEDLAKSFDRWRLECNVASLIGSGVSALSGFGASAGIVMLFMSVPGVVGMILACGCGMAMGTVLSIGSSVEEMELTRHECEEFQKVMDKDKENTELLIKALEKYNDKKNRIIENIERTAYTDKKLSEINKQDTIRCQKTAVGIWAYDKGQQFSKQVQTEVTESYGELASAAGIGGKILSEKVETVAVGFAGGVATDVLVGVAAAIIPIISAALDIYTMAHIVNNMCQDSPSEVAKKCREMANVLGKDKDRIDTIIPKECKI